VKSLIAFSQQVLEDFGDQCGVSTTRDFEEVSRRVEHEGESFLTITLAAFGKQFLASLEAGRVEPNTFMGFSHGRAGLPRFLGGFLAQVFDEYGVVRSNPSIEAIRAIHGFTAMFAKKKELCSPERISAAMHGFAATDAEVGAFAETIPTERLEALQRVFNMLFGRALDVVDRKVFNGEILPKHGPGATAEKLSSNGKYLHEVWTERLEFYFPAGENLFPNWGWYNQLQRVNFCKPSDESPVRVVAVPKTAVTPRIIAIEPAHMQYVQQGILEALTSALQMLPVWDVMGNLDQTPNQRLALEGSLSGDLATLDLSEASDRVSLRVVEKMLGHYPSLREAVLACRSQTADVLGIGIIPLSKFASMGSALCFPIESMVFTAIIFERLLNEFHIDPAAWASSLEGRVRVYGDDIIVPVDYVESIIDSLEAFGLKVNRRKSFWKSNFRESCGLDAYAGHRITPIRLRSAFPTDRRQATELAKTISFRNQLYAEMRFEKAVKHLDQMIKAVFPQVRNVPVGHSGLGLWADDYVVRQCVRLHKPLVRAHVLEHTLPEDYLEEHGALMKWFLKRGDKPFDKNHLSRAGRPQTVRIKSGWLPLLEG